MIWKERDVVELLNTPDARLGIFAGAAAVLFLEVVFIGLLEIAGSFGKRGQ